jgi:uncharacterized protein (UPF0371 family)
MKLIDDLRGWKIAVMGSSSPLRQTAGAVLFKNKLERRGIRSSPHRFTKAIPTTGPQRHDEATVNDSIPTDKPL